MASDVQICNMALSHLGAEALVSSIDPPDGSVEAGYCRTFYAPARVEALEFANWPWAMKRVALAQVALPAGTTWQYAYAIPSDCLQAVRILPLTEATAVSVAWPVYPPTSTGLVDEILDERGSAAFEIEGDTLLTNEPDAVLKYKADITDATKFSASFANGLAMLLASYLAGPIIKGVDGMRVGSSWRQAAVAALGQAASRDLNTSSESADFTPRQIGGRA